MKNLSKQSQRACLQFQSNFVPGFAGSILWPSVAVPVSLPSLFPHQFRLWGNLSLDICHIFRDSYRLTRLNLPNSAVKIAGSACAGTAITSITARGSTTTGFLFVHLRQIVQSSTVYPSPRSCWSSDDHHPIWMTMRSPPKIYLHHLYSLSGIIAVKFVLISRMTV
jgi:hypothetical protein